MSQKIQCPKCNTTISIDDILSDQIEEKMRADFEIKQREKEFEFSKKNDELKRKMEVLEIKTNELDSIISKKVSIQLSSEKIQIYQEAKAASEKEQEDKISFFQEELKSREEKLKKANNLKLKMNKKNKKRT